MPIIILQRDIGCISLCMSTVLSVQEEDLFTTQNPHVSVHLLSSSAQSMLIMCIYTCKLT